MYGKYYGKENNMGVHETADAMISLVIEFCITNRRAARPQRSYFVDKTMCHVVLLLLKSLHSTKYKWGVLCHVVCRATS